MFIKALSCAKLVKIRYREIKPKIGKNSINIHNCIYLHRKSRKINAHSVCGGRDEFVAEFQKIAKRDKKAFFSDQCKEIEEKNRMGKMRSLQENERSQGNISCKDGLDEGQKWYGPNRSRRY